MREDNQILDSHNAGHQHKMDLPVVSVALHVGVKLFYAVDAQHPKD